MIHGDRRQRLKQLGLTLAWLGASTALPLPVRASAGLADCRLRSQATRWHQRADQIIASINKTAFPARTLTITEFGARAGDDCSAALAAAISRCHELGGGTVLVPPGLWPTGPIRLRSHINLQLEAGATLSFSTDASRYLPAVKTRWEGVELMGYQPLIYAHDEENVAITGAGVIDGNASDSAWWPWKGAWQNDGKQTPWPLDPTHNQSQSRAQLFAWGEQGTPVAERQLSDNYLRPPLIQLYQCRRVLIEGVTLKNSPFWLLNPVLSDDVIVRRIIAQSHGPNSDGCNPESCRRVLIEHCRFDTGDDCIALKSGRNADGRRLNVPVQQVVIQDCEMQAGHGGVVIGSEISAGARDVIARRCRFDSPSLERGLRIKTNTVRGGEIADIALLDCEIGTVNDAIVIDLHYEEGDSGNWPPNIHDIYIDNLRCEHASRAFAVRGLARAPIRGLHLNNVHFAKAERGVLEHVAALQLDCVSINGQSVSA